MSRFSKIPGQHLAICLLAALLIALSLWLGLYERLEEAIGYTTFLSLDRLFLVGFILAGSLCWMLLLQARATRHEASIRERLEIERGDREERHRQLLDSTHAVPWEADARTWRFTYVGPQAAKVLGHPIERWTEPEFWSSHLHPEDRRRALEFCRSQSAESTDYEFEYRWITEDGRVLWIHDIVHVGSRNGTPDRLRGFMIDVTESRRAAQELEQAHQDLERRVEARTFELRRANEALQQRIREQTRSDAVLRHYQERLRGLATELALAEERERRRIAGELHDRTIQSLGMSRIKLGALLKSRRPLERKTLTNDLRALLEGAIHDTRSLIFELSPPILYELGFEPAVEWLVERLQERSGICGRFRDDHVKKPLAHDLQVALFQAVRELLDNIEKHADASRFEVELSRIEDEIRVRIEDDGIGFDPAIVCVSPPSPTGYGLFSIRERLGLLGGSIEIESSPGGGTQVAIIAPLAQAVRSHPISNQGIPDFRAEVKT